MIRVEKKEAQMTFNLTLRFRKKDTAKRIKLGDAPISPIKKT